MISAPLPRGWKSHIKSSLLHAISLYWSTEFIWPFRARNRLQSHVL